MSQRASILGVDVSAVSMDEVLGTVDRLIDGGGRGYICTADVHALMECLSEEKLRRVYEQATIVAPDGMPLVWVLHRDGYLHADRVCGPDLMPALFGHSEQKQYRHFLYGSTESTLLQLQKQLEIKFPKSVIAGSFSPPFRALAPHEDAAIIQLINDAEPDIVWVGLGAPKQDRWMGAHRESLNAPVLIGVGAAFDMIAGTVRRAPRFIRRSGCEWMYRLAQEPRRLWRRYLKSNSQFLIMLAEERMHLTKRSADLR